MLQTIITFVLVFGVIVVIHEFGHFFFAKRSGILVREFAIGMGPKIFYHRGKDGTAYTIRLLPVGGYVRMAGQGDEEAEIHPGTQLSVVLDENEVVQRINLSSKKQLANAVPMEVMEVDLEDNLFVKGYVNGDDSDPVLYKVAHEATIIEQDGTEILIAPRDVQFQSAKLWQRMLTNFAGPMNNFILGTIIFILLVFLQGGVATGNTNRIGEVGADTPAARAGLRENDEILSIDGKEIHTWNDLTSAIAPNPNNELTMIVKDAHKTREVQITPILNPNPNIEQATGIIGITQPLDRSVGALITGGFRLAWQTSLVIFQAIGQLISRPSLNQLGGPVMMFEMSREASQAGLPTILSLMAMLSMNLGMMNLMPIPALDGGKLVLNIIEAIRRKPLSPEKEGIITLIGAGFMVLLMILVTWNDISRFFLR